MPELLVAWAVGRAASAMPGKHLLLPVLVLVVLVVWPARRLQLLLQVQVVAAGL